MDKNHTRTVKTPALKAPINILIQKVHQWWTFLNEVFLNIETEYSSSGPGALIDLPDFRGMYSDKAKHYDNVRYGTMDYFQIRRMVHIIDPGVDDVFYDIGCGKGRILCEMARRRLKRVAGIDLFEELCTVARTNAERLRGKKTPIDVICADATNIDFADGTIFFLFNPFGEATMRAVIQSIDMSRHKNPRNIRICYSNPVHEYILAEKSWLEKYANLKTMGGYDVSFWRTNTIHP